MPTVETACVARVPREGSRLASTHRLGRLGMPHEPSQQQTPAWRIGIGGVALGRAHWPALRRLPGPSSAESNTTDALPLPCQLLRANLPEGRLSSSCFRARRTSLIERLLFLRKTPKDPHPSRRLKSSTDDP